MWCVCGSSALRLGASVGSDVARVDSACVPLFEVSLLQVLVNDMQTAVVNFDNAALITCMGTDFPASGCIRAPGIIAVLKTDGDDQYVSYRLKIE